MILDNIVKEHKASKEEAEDTGKDKANDLLGVLLDLQEHGELEVPLTMNNIKAVLLVSMFMLCLCIYHQVFHTSTNKVYLGTQ